MKKVPIFISYYIQIINYVILLFLFSSTLNVTVRYLIWFKCGETRKVNMFYVLDMLSVKRISIEWQHAGI